MTIIPLDLPEPLATHYFDLSRGNGMSLSALIAADLEAYHEYRRHLDNEFERL